MTHSAVIQEDEKFVGNIMMVWGGIILDERTELVVIPGRLNAACYVDMVLVEHVVPTAFDIVFIQDNALNSIEYVWDMTIAVL